MDYYNFNPSFEDSLAFLSPAAQTNTRLSNRGFKPDYIRAENVQYMRNQISFEQSYYRPLSNTSLILKKTKDREIVEQYCDGNIRYRPYPYPKLSKPVQIPKHRPLIRVTVIPNNNTATPTKLRKRRSNKKIHSTTSNHESFFKAKNIFLVVTSSKRDKVYEIKPTGSEYSKGARYHEDIPVEQNYQQLLSSLNMDKKKKKDKKGKKEKDKKKDDDSKMDTGSAASLMNVMANADSPLNSILKECICPPPMDTVSPRKSRVRITGKIGLTEDDRYVLKCAATIDGKPVETNFFQEQHIGRSITNEWEDQPTREIPRVCMPCPSIFGRRENNIQKEVPKVCQKDEIVQCNCDQDQKPAYTQEDQYRTYPCPAFKNTCPAFRSVETQYSPQNINAVCFSNIDKLKLFSSRDQDVQCNCPQDLIMNTNNIGIDVDFDKNANSPKSCNSPLVIISVYPKKDSNDKFYEEENFIQEERESRPPPKEKAKAKKDKKDEKGGKEDKKKGKRSRSPSPAKAKEDKKSEKPKGKGKVKDKGDNDKLAKGNKKAGKKEKLSKDEKKSIGSKSPERRPSGTQFGISVGRCAECCMGCVGNSKIRPDNPQGAAQFSTKRMMNWVSAKSDVSNVAINIDGENEFYDVLFRQGDITTDLQVRKTLKDAQSYKNYANDGSLDNFFLEPDDFGRQRKRSFSQTYIDDLPIADNTETLDQTIPPLHVRDSIEISHRREEKNSSHSVTFTSTASSSSTASHPKIANAKHFQGDNCELPNPVERDKEIRELLGIEKPRASPSKTYQEFAAKAEMDCKCSVHCFYRRQRKTNVSTVNNIQELKRLCMDDAVTQASDDDDVIYMGEEYHDDDEYNIECLVCKDTEVPIAPNHYNSPIAYGCELGNKCKNKRQPCEKRSVLNTSSSSLQPRRQSDFNAPGKSFVSQRRSTLAPRSSMQTSDGRRIRTPIDPSREPCSVVVTCPYDIPNEEEEEDEFYQEIEDRAEERTSKFDRPSRLSDGKRICDPKQPGKDPCGVIVQCPYKNVNDDEILEDENTKQRKSSAFVEENTVVPIEDEPFEQSPPLYQQLILNRNINIYLQIEQFTKQKPIILSRKQYEKVKRAIECTGTKTNNCICKKPSKSRVSGEIRRKSSEKKEAKPSVSDKLVQCECNEPVKEKKKSGFWGRKKSKEEEARKKLQEPMTIFGGKQCTSNVSFVSSNNEAIKEPSEDSVIEENKRVTQTRTSNPFLGCSKQCDESIRRKSRRPRFVNSEYINPEVTEEYSATCCKRINPNLVEEGENLENETKNTRRTLQEEDLGEYGNQNRKSRQYRKTNLDNEDILLYDDGQRKQSRKTKTARKSKLYDTERKSKRDSRKYSNRVSELGDETFEQEGYNNESRRSRHRERESEFLRDQSSQPICCNPVVMPKDDIGMSRTQTPQERELTTTDAPKSGLHNCKRCGRLKQLQACGNCGRLNGGCLHTCYCYELQEGKPEPSIKDIFISKDRQYAASSTEVRYTSIIYANYKHVTFSSANVPNENVVPSAANLLVQNYNSNSLHTIFKGRCRTPTPNLGTSAYSLYSEYSDATSAKNQAPPQPLPERKPFLRRLMSCLVMRSKTSNIKIDAGRQIPKMTANSSVDSYHINTSLGAVEMSSSIYDTSASFYSNHSIQPISSKIIKRGFLSSVRGFLTNRKT